jgi:hypothetical protein
MAEARNGTTTRSTAVPTKGVNLGNEALIFHEALHGWTSLDDNIPPFGRPIPQIRERLGLYGNRASCSITLRIEHAVFCKTWDSQRDICSNTATSDPLDPTDYDQSSDMCPSGDEDSPPTQ